MSRICRMGTLCPLHGFCKAWFYNHQTRFSMIDKSRIAWEEGHRAFSFRSHRDSIYSPCHTCKSLSRNICISLSCTLIKITIFWNRHYFHYPEYRPISWTIYLDKWTLMRLDPNLKEQGPCLNYVHFC